MLEVIKFQLSVFGKLEEFVPTPELITQIFNIFKGHRFSFLPNIINVMLLDIKETPQGIQTPQPTPQPRLQLIDKGNGIEIVLLPERIDITFKSDYGYKRDTFDVKCDLEEIQKLLLEHLAKTSSIKYTRLAMNMSFGAPKDSPEDISQTRAKLLNPLSCNKKTEVKEWHYMTNCPITVKINDRDTSLNILLTSIYNAFRNANYIMHSIDINTTASNSEAIYDLDNVLEFNQIATSHFEDIYNCVKEL